MCARYIRERRMRTRVFRSGNSQAVRIPVELQLPPGVKEVEIEAMPGGDLLIRPALRRLTGLADSFSAMGALGWLPDGQRPDAGEELERDWGTWGAAKAGNGEPG